MRSVIAYTGARLLLFAVTFGVLYLLGARGFLALALAFLVSGLVSYVLLSKQRDAMSATVAEGIAGMRGMGERLEQGAAKEDEAQQGADAGRAEQNGRGETPEQDGRGEAPERTDGSAPAREDTRP
ncbi:hypothetical protein HDA32_005037 [Spinactinospora alkalitolerans]|uniref:DUF4229 domain-containing protein n=1 Tax=Spinactinospora alkalitolerans TaxID=687207 RepID=A0A852U2U6_9ACTN|nr:DUF4229 domain-containing protein [Spinactinospora alkalitolerans]NYE49917.1 hypothetical protein [Spinactinospora alkalitolerans]